MPRRYRRPVPDSPTTDPQRERLYRMEAEAMKGWDAGKMTLPQMRAWAKRVSRQYAVPEVKIATDDLGPWAAHYWDGVVTVSREGGSGKTVATLAHEMSHHLHWTFVGGPAEPYHGPAFVTCYMHLLDVTRCLPVPAMKALLKQYKVRHIELPRWDCKDTLVKAVKKAHA